MKIQSRMVIIVFMGGYYLHYYYQRKRNKLPIIYIKHDVEKEWNQGPKRVGGNSGIYNTFLFLVLLPRYANNKSTRFLYTNCQCYG